MGSAPEEGAWVVECARNASVGNLYVEMVAAETPRHAVKITNSFYLGAYPVTQAEYEKIIGVNPSAFTAKQMATSTFAGRLSEADVKQRREAAQKLAGNDTRRYPVETVSWDDAAEFCRRLSAIPSERAARRVYRLPTEAEWEYACRAGTATRWCFGDDEAVLSQYAWLGGNADARTHPVGEKKPNAWGLFDMHGNVNNWCADCYSASYYKQSPSCDPKGPRDGNRVLRGGGYWGNPLTTRSASRAASGGDRCSAVIGFRVVVGP